MMIIMGIPANDDSVSDSIMMIIMCVPANGDSMSDSIIMITSMCTSMASMCSLPQTQALIYSSVPSIR